VENIVYNHSQYLRTSTKTHNYVDNLVDTSCKGRHVGIFLCRFWQKLEKEKGFKPIFALFMALTSARGLITLDYSSPQKPE
jgi:hypothetical protein